MSKKNEDILAGGVYDIAFNERDTEIRQVELMRKYINADLEEAIAEYVKAGGSKKLLKKKSSAKVPDIALDGIDPSELT